MRTFVLLLAVLGAARALQAPVEYEYAYEARVGSGIQAARPQFAGTGIRATVKVTVRDENDADFQVSDIMVGEKSQALDDDGHAPLDIQYAAIKGSGLEQLYTAHLNKKDGDTVLEVPQNDLLWMTNIRRGIANFFRIAPIIDPSSVKPSDSGDKVDPQSFSRDEDTYAGRCQVGYSVSKASPHDLPPEPTEDIQSMKARKGPGGRQIQLDDDYYRVQSSLDHSTCRDRVALMQTGATNLTNVTDSSFRDVAVRSLIGQYVLKGSPGKFRIESGVVESEFLIDPFGVNTDKMITISNQTMQLKAARPVPGGLKISDGPTKEIKTWAQQVQSPNQPPQGYAPRWVEYKKDSDSASSPIFYERLASGFGLSDEFRQNLQQRALQALQRAAAQLQIQNKDRTDKPQQYKGSEDGRAAQSLHEAHRLIRAMRKDDIQKLEQQLQKQAQQCQLCYDLYIEALAVAASGASLDQLIDKIQSGELSDNRTASIFFSLANNVQSPEALDKILQFAMSLEEEQKSLASLLVKPNLAIMIRRLCVSEQEQAYSHMAPVFGDKQCDRDSVLNKYLSNLEQKIKSSDKIWIKILNVLAVADLGAREGLDILSQVAQGKITSDIFVRYAAIHGMSASIFDNCTQDEIFNIVQPIAESQSEDFRIRQVAYDTLLSWRPNVTLIQRMATSAWKEASIQIQSYLYNAIDSLAVNDDYEFKPQSSAARNLRSFTKQMEPSAHRSFTYKDSRYLDKEQVGAEAEISWLTGLRTYFPREIYSYVVAQLGRVRIPLMETVTFGNVASARTYSRDILSALRGNIRQDPQHRHVRDSSDDDESEADLYHYTKIFDSSELFLPLTDELFAKAEESGRNLLRGRSSDDDSQALIYKYFNPVEINLILPTPTGLFTLTEVSSPTVVFVNLKTEAKFSIGLGVSDPTKLPQLDDIDITAQGIVKAITKANTYTYVFAPWTNKTAVAAVDNEKSFSLPLKLRLAADVKLPAQQVWAQITPQFNQSSDSIPVVKVRNVPFTGVGKRPLPSPANSEDFDDVDRARWTYDDSQMLQKSLPISADATGLNAEVKYMGEMELPIDQPNILRMILEPSRLSSLIASPSIKNYDLSLYRKPGDPQNKNIGLSLRHIMKKGSGSSQIQVPDDAHKPIDISPDDSLDQRQQKLAQFSSENNHEFSAHANFTGGDNKIYEAAIIAAEQERTENSEQVKRTFYKIQATLLEKNSKSDRKPKTCVVLAIDRPELIPTKKSDSGESSNPPFVQSKIAADVYEGSNLKPDTSIAKSTADLTVSDNRMKAMMELDPSGDFYFTNSSELYRLAVYDQMHLRLDWQTPSPQVKNATLRARDLLEGYMFPKIVKNRLSPNQANQMDVVADRSIADDRVDAWVRLPKATVHAERVEIQSWFDYLTSFTDNIFGVYDSPNQKTFSSRLTGGDGRCHITKEHVQTADGVSFSVHPSACEVVAADVKKGGEHLQVTHAQYPQEFSDDKFVRVKSDKDGAEVIIQGKTVRVNGKDLDDTEDQTDITDPSGRVVGQVSRNNGQIDIEITDKLIATLQSDHTLLVSVDDHFKSESEGLCGNFNGSPGDDLRGPRNCSYDPSSQGEMFGASWVKQDQLPCNEPGMKPILDKVSDYQQRCKQSVTAQQCGGLEAYPIEDIDGDTCVAETKEPVCQPGCESSDKVPVPGVRFKCYKKGNEPSDVLDGEQQGYMTSPPSKNEDSIKTTTYAAPVDCKPALLNAKNGNDAECYVKAYPVSQEGPMVCVSNDQADMCKSECRIIDTQPRDVQGNCWNYSDAPQAVRDGLRKGYTDQKVSDGPQFERRMAVHAARLCSKPGQ